MKKILITGLLMMLFSATVFADSTAVQTTSKVLINNNEVAFEAYTINSNNYFKLRDVALALSGTTAQFEVTWDDENNTINLLTGKSYTAVGGELAAGDGTPKDALKSISKIRLDSEEIPSESLNAYTILGNNYFKLRDLGKLFNFSVDWDGEANCIMITTGKSLLDYKEIGELVTVARIKDNKKAIYSLTTDDNYDYTNKWINKKIHELDLKATMGLITSQMGGVGKLTWEDAHALVQTGRWGVASHTQNHRQDVFASLPKGELDTEINGAREILISKFPNLKHLSMYTPGGITNNLIKEVVKEEHLVLRHAGGGNNFLPASSERLLQLNAQAVLSSTSLETMNSWIDSAIRGGQWCVEMWHGVGYQDASNWGGNISEDYAEEHLRYVAKKNKDGYLWVSTLDEVAVYMKELENSQLTEVTKTDSELTFTLTDGLNNKVYDEELTLNIEIPSAFKGATVKQGKTTLKTVIKNGQVSVNVKPDNGDILVNFTR